MARSTLVESQALLASTEVRPEPERMARLIGRGLTEADLRAAWQSAGNEMPTMEHSLTEVDSLVPFIQTLSDAVYDATGPNDVALFAGRDVEIVFDDYAITHDPNGSSSHLLPASSRLWQATDWNDKRLGRDFLASYGVSADIITDPSVTINFFDGGFRGSVGVMFDEKIEELYGISLRKAGRLAIMLACADPDGDGQQVVDMEPVKYAWRPFPKTTRVLRYENEYSRYGGPYLQTVALQSIPHYHGPFVGMARRGRRVIGVPEASFVNRDVDTYSLVSGAINPSYVNPLIAAIAQHRVVSAALRRAIGHGSNSK